MQTIRLPLIDPYFLFDCVQSFPPVHSNPECMKLVEEAKYFHLLPDRNSEILNERTRQRDNANMMDVSSHRFLTHTDLNKKWLVLTVGEEAYLVT